MITKIKKYFNDTAIYDLAKFANMSETYFKQTIEFLNTLETEKVSLPVVEPITSGAYKLTCNHNGKQYV